MDDFFLLAKKTEELSKITALILDLFRELGRLVNFKKSQTMPSQRVEYLGVLFLLDSRELSLPEEKVIRIVKLCKEIAGESHRSRCQLEQLLGLLNFASPLVPLGRLRLRPLIRWMNAHTSTITRDRQVPLGEAFKEVLMIWENPSFLRTPVPMNLPSPTISLMTDTAQSSCAGVILPDKIKGLWNLEENKLSINWKELKAIELSLRHFLNIVKGKSVLVRTDNTTAVSCILNQGTLRSTPLLLLSKVLLEFCQLHAITLIPKHPPGGLNVLADQGSRQYPILTEWSINQRTFDYILDRNGPLKLDVFATREITH